MTKLPPTLPVWAVAALTLVFAHQPWWTITWSSGLQGSGGTPLTGTDATGGLAQALALVALAGAASTLVLRALGRRVVAVVVALAFVGVAVLGLLAPTPGADAVRAALGAASLADSWEVARTAWPDVYGAAGVLGVLACVGLAVRPVAVSSRPVRASADKLDDSLASWKAMDDGLDPTQE